MRDLAEKWPLVPDWDTATIDTGNLRIRTLSGFDQRLVSGNLEAWARVSGMAGESVGAGEGAHGDRYMVRVARDRVLAVSNVPFDIAPGWHGDGFAVSMLDAGLHIFEIAGEGTPELLARASTLNSADKSPSAALSFAGVNTLLYRHGGANSMRLHVDRGLSPYLWEWCVSSSKRIPP